MPYNINAECPCCGKRAKGVDEIERLFGWRTPKGRETIPESYCKACRSAGCKKGEPCKAK